MQRFDQPQAESIDYALTVSSSACCRPTSHNSWVRLLADSAVEYELRVLEALLS